MYENKQSHRLRLIETSTLQHCMYMLQERSILFQVNFDLSEVDSQFPFPPGLEDKGN